MTGVYILLGFLAGIAVECWLEKQRNYRRMRDMREAAMEIAETMKGIRNAGKKDDSATADRESSECEGGDQSAYEEAMAGFGRNEIS